MSFLVLWGGFIFVLAGCAAQREQEEGQDQQQALEFTTQRCSTNLIKDGGFENPVNVSMYGYETFLNGRSFGDASSTGVGVWNVEAPVFSPPLQCAIALFPNSYSTSNHLFHKTPDGHNFVDIGLKSQGENSPDYPNCSLSQLIQTDLVAGKLYKLSFLQSAFKYPSLQTIPGNVFVQIYLKDPSSSIYSEHFKVCPGSAWVFQGGDVTVPSSSGGQYTIAFSSDDPKSVSIIDAVWLTEK